MTTAENKQRMAKALLRLKQKGQNDEEDDLTPAQRLRLQQRRNQRLDELLQVEGAAEILATGPRKLNKHLAAHGIKPKSFDDGWQDKQKGQPQLTLSQVKEYAANSARDTFYPPDMYVVKQTAPAKNNRALDPFFPEDMQITKELTPADAQRMLKLRDLAEHASINDSTLQALIDLFGIGQVEEILNILVGA